MNDKELQPLTIISNDPLDDWQGITTIDNQLQ